MFGSQLPKTAGIYMQMLYRYLNFGWSAWQSWIKTISGLRQRELADDSVDAVRTLGGTHQTHRPPRRVTERSAPRTLRLFSRLSTNNLYNLPLESPNWVLP